MTSQYLFAHDQTEILNAMRIEHHSHNRHLMLSSNLWNFILFACINLDLRFAYQYKYIYFIAKTNMLTTYSNNCIQKWKCWYRIFTQKKSPVIIMKRSWISDCQQSFVGDQRSEKFYIKRVNIHCPLRTFDIINDCEFRKLYEQLFLISIK